MLLARDPADRRLWLADSGEKSGVSEVVNDLDGVLMNFWRVLRDEATFAQFRRRLGATPFSHAEWDAASRHTYGSGDAVADACAFFVHCRQSMAGRRDRFTPLTKARTRGGMNADANAWWSAVEGLVEVHARLRGVVMECRPALEVIQQQDSPVTLHYADPPYVSSTRAAGASEYGAHEMTDAQHAELLNVLRQVRGKVMISGYPSDLYERALGGWNRHTFDVANAAASGKVKARECECVWTNY